jgi:outer membrane protein
MKKSLFALAAIAALGSGSAMAQNAGDWVLGAGWLHFAPQDSSTPLRFTSPINATVPGSGASVGSSDTLGLSATYFFDSSWALEGVFGVPPTFKLEGEGSLAPLGQLGDAKQWSPTLLAKYYFGSGNDAFRPFVGAGATYVWYSDVNLTSNLQNTLGGRLGRPAGSTNTKAKLDDSFAPVFNIGAGYQIDKHWGVSFSVSYIPLKTKAKLTTRTAAGTTIGTSETKLTLNPIVTYLQATYRF